MVSLVKRFTGNVPQSDKGPARNNEGTFIQSSPSGAPLFASPVLDLKRFAAINSAIKTQGSYQFYDSMDKRNVHGAFSSPLSRRLWQFQVKNRKVGTSGNGVDSNVSYTNNQPVFYDSANASTIFRSGLLSKAVISRRNSCVASIQVPDSEANSRSFSPTHIQISDQLHISKLLGAGGFGSVYMAVLDRKKVAIKKFHAKTNNEKAKAESFRAESKAKTLHHPNIVRVFGTSSSEHIDCVIMEYTGDQNLQQLFNNLEKPLDMSRRISYVFDIIAAVKFIHENNLVHLDIKPANILVTPYDTCKLGDFGCCQVIENGVGRVSPTQRSYLTGTFAYRAPELLRGEQPTMKADIYSFGITLWQLANCEQPYSGQNQHVVVFGVVAYNLRPEASHLAVNTSNTNEQYYKSIYSQCWDASPMLRPAAEVLNDLFKKWKTECIFE